MNTGVCLGGRVAATVAMMDALAGRFISTDHLQNGKLLGRTSATGHVDQIDILLHF